MARWRWVSEFPGSVFLSVRGFEFALLRLHKGYNIPANTTITRKLGQQYVGPFKVLRRVGRLANELEFPPHWRIYPVITVAMLEPAPAPGTDPFGRPTSEQPDSVHVEGDTTRKNHGRSTALSTSKETAISYAGRDGVHNMINGVPEHS